MTETEKSNPVLALADALKDRETEAKETARFFQKAAAGTLILGIALLYLSGVFFLQETEVDKLIVQKRTAEIVERFKRTETTIKDVEDRSKKYLTTMACSEKMTSRQLKSFMQLPIQAGDIERQVGRVNDELRGLSKYLKDDAFKPIRVTTEETSVVFIAIALTRFAVGALVVALFWFFARNYRKYSDIALWFGSRADTLAAVSDETLNRSVLALMDAMSPPGFGDHDQAGATQLTEKDVLDILTKKLGG